jgi:hypothetical protein
MPAACQRLLAPGELGKLTGLNNPETPPRIYSALSDEVLDLQNDVWSEEMDTERCILRALNHRAQLAKEAGR